MSIEAPQTTPAEALAPASQLVDLLRSSIMIEPCQLVPGHHQMIPQTEISGAVNAEAGIDQSLLAVIDTYGEQFGVVNVTDTTTGQQKTVLTHIDKENSRAILVDEIRQGKSVIVGRTSENGYDPQTSRQHFTIEKTEEGELSIVDLNSANGTEIFTAPNTQENLQTANSSLRGFVKNAIHRGHKFKEQPVESATIDRDLSWSVKSATLKRAFEVEAIKTGALSAIEAKLRPELETDYEPHKASAESLLQTAQLLMNEQPELATIAQEMIVNDSLFGHEIPPTMGKGGINTQLSKLESLLRIYSTDPELAKLLVDRNVAGFHGSSSGSLMGVLRHGLLSANEARNRPGVQIVTGERTYSKEGGQTSISFADLYASDTIKSYSAGRPLTVEELADNKSGLEEAADSYKNENHVLVRNARTVTADIQAQIDFIMANPDSTETQLMMENFPVIYGVDIGGYDMYETVNSVPTTEKGEEHVIRRVPSDIDGEFIITTPTIEPAKIAVIAVPEDKVDAVRELVKLFGHETTYVAAIEKIVA